MVQPVHLKILAVYLLMLLPALLIAQNSRNSLYPNQLLVENLCPLDSGFLVNAEGTPWNGMYFSIEYTAKSRFANTLCELASYKNNTSYNNRDRTGFYPYDIETYPEFNTEELFFAFGGEINTVYTAEDELLIYESPIDTSEIKAVQFIEEWQLDTSRLNFSKKVKGFIPIRKHYNPIHEEDLFYQTSIILQEAPKKLSNKKKLVAKVKYEVLLFDQDNETLQKLTQQDEYYIPGTEELFSREIPYNPFLSSYSRNMLIEFMRNASLKQKLGTYDFITNKKINNAEEIKNGLGENLVTVPVTNLETGELFEMEIWEQTSSIKSVIFCEEWYLDPKTGYFSKVVAGIAPVLWDTQYNHKKIRLTLWFDEEKIF